MGVLRIVRGLPGSGKTVVSKALWGFEFNSTYLDANMFRCGPYSSEQNKFAHERCREEAKRSLEAGRDVTIANTFTRQWEVDEYVDYLKEFATVVQFVKVVGAHGNTHGVPDDKIAEMAARWEDLPVELTLNNKEYDKELAWSV